MGRKKIPGLICRKGIWHIDKIIRGRRICESTGTSDLEEAEKYLARRMEQIRQAEVYGVRLQRIFRDAAIKYVNETTKASVKDAVWCIKQVDKFIGKLPLEGIHMGTLQPFIDDCIEKGWKSRIVTIPCRQ